MKEKSNVRCLEHKCMADECQHGGHYSIYSTNDINDIKRIFPDGKANDMNWLVASTSGVHGMYTTLDEIEKAIYIPLVEQKENEYYPSELTILVIMPRLVCMMYGCIEVKTQEDVDYFRKLITSSVEQIKETQKENLLK